MGEHQSHLWGRCWRGNLEKVRKALQAGADPNTTGGKCDSSCLFVALQNNHMEVADLLLSQPGIQVNAKNRYGQSALHFACAKGNVASVKKLLSIPGILVNEREGPEGTGTTPIKLAIASGSIDIVRLLIAAPGILMSEGGCATGWTPIRSGWTPIREAIRLGRIEIVHLLVNVKEVNLKVTNIQRRILEDSAPE